MWGGSGGRLLSPTQILEDDDYRLSYIFHLGLFIGACALLVLAAFAFAVVHSSSNTTTTSTVTAIWTNMDFGVTTNVTTGNIEKNESIDMTPYIAKDIPLSDRFWSNKDTTSCSGKDGRVIYHLHLHKNMGCKWFCATTRCNPRNNCNVPDAWWYNKSELDLHYQWGA